MLTTGFKLFFGFCLAAALGAVVFGYTTGGDHVGPLTLGIVGSVGDHRLGYITLVSLAAVFGAVGVMLALFRDADPGAQAGLLGTAEAPALHRAQPSYWPLVGTVGAGTAVVGLVVHGALFVIGAVIVAIAAVEWTMQAWADRATGDPEVNRSLRDRIMQPIELPVAAALAIVAVPLAASRIFLAVSKLGAVWAATVISGIVFLGAILLSLRPRVSKNVTAGIVLVGGLALVAGGIVAAVIGERDIEPHGAHHDEGAWPAPGAPGTGW